MNSLISSKLAEIESLCRTFAVRRLDVFGSATGSRFDAGVSDLDFLVEFDDAAGLTRADQYFGLLEGLERLLVRKIDLVTAQSVRNPYFQQAVEQSRQQLYAA